jgi:hypothetical protein
MWAESHTAPAISFHYYRGQEAHQPLSVDCQLRPYLHLCCGGWRCESKCHECGNEVEESLYLQADCQARAGSEYTGEECAYGLHCSEQGEVGAQDPPSRPWLAVALEDGH